MSPLYSIVNALTQTAAAITLILAFLLSFSLAFSAFFFLSLFLSAIFPGSISISHFPSLHILSCFCLAQNKCAHTHAPHTHTLVTNSLSLESNSGTLKHLRSPLFFAFLIMHIILPLLVNCTK